MRIVSLLPAATEIVCALGLENQLLAISHGCSFPDYINSKPRISSTDIDYNAISSKEIDRHVEESMHQKKSLYKLDKKMLVEIKPTHILTQALCDVCAITPSDIQKVIVDLRPSPEVIELNPRSIEQIYQDILSLGQKFGKSAQAKRVVAGLKNKVGKIRKKTQEAVPKLVFCLEWLDPLYACGHWVPEMVDIAGGQDPLSFPEAYSCKIPWSEVVRVDPEIIIVMACSFSIERTLQELPTVTSLPLWTNLRAVKNNNVWVVDGSSYFNQSGIRTVDQGIEILAKIIHPEIFGKPIEIEAIHQVAV